MKKKLSILILVLVMGMSMVQGQTTVTPATVGAANLTGVTSLTVTGSWNDSNLGTLKNKLITAKATLTTVNMSAATLTGDISNGFNDMFSFFGKLMNLTLPSARHSSQVSFAQTFYSCSSLKSVDLSGFMNITKMSDTFSNCSSLTSVKLPVSNIYDGSVAFGSAFLGCSALESIDLSGFSNIGDLWSAFNGCGKLTSVKLPANNVSTNAVLFSNTFSGCSALKSVDLSGFSNIYTMDFAFLNCSNLTSVKLPVWNTSASAISFSNAFRGCASLESIDLSGFSRISSVLNAFDSCSELIAVFLGDVPPNYYADAFTGANPGCVKFVGREGFDNTGYNWTNVVLSSADGTASAIPDEMTHLALCEGAEWNNAALTNLSKTLQVFVDKTELKEVNFSGIIFAVEGITTGFAGMFKNFESLSEILFPPGEYNKPVSFNKTFSGCSALASIDISMFTNISDVTDAFQNCATLTSLFLGSVPANNYADAFTGANANCVKFVGKTDFNNGGYNWTNVIVPAVKSGKVTHIALYEGTEWGNDALANLGAALRNSAIERYLKKNAPKK